MEINEDLNPKLNNELAMTQYGTNNELNSHRQALAILNINNASEDSEIIHSNVRGLRCSSIPAVDVKTRFGSILILIQT